MRTAKEGKWANSIAVTHHLVCNAWSEEGRMNKTLTTSCNILHMAINLAVGRRKNRTAPLLVSVGIGWYVGDVVFGDVELKFLIKG